jgi:phosphatidylglycerol:prolipoprotein diacylglycerol transferase
MKQVLFHIPIYVFDSEGIPVYGYGGMLFVAFILTMLLAAVLARRERIRVECIQDMAIWIFVGGIVGARITYMIQYGVPLSQFLKIWDGGLVFYGSAIGGVVGYFLAYGLILRKYGIPTWRVADLVAPCAALGLCLGRIGCFLNGCCYGNVACEHCPAVSFPLSAAPREDMVRRGYQTAAGFTMDPTAAELNQPRVGRVEPDSPADSAGLKDGDLIIKARTGDHEQDIKSYAALENFLSLGRGWPRGETELQLTVARADGIHELELFQPWTIPLHPTQLYESISMLLLLGLLLAFYPFRRRPGEVMVLFMLCYAVHRFFNEMLRDDTDPITLLGVNTHMTLSQNVSVLVLVAAVLLGLWLRRQPAEPGFASLASSVPASVARDGSPIVATKAISATAITASKDQASGS